jgi:hypothetical protein
MPKRTFWLTAGVALGAGSTLWAERRVRRTIEQTAAKLAPDALVTEVGRTARHVAESAGDRFRDAYSEGRDQMHRHEEELWSGLAERGIALSADGLPAVAAARPAPPAPPALSADSTETTKAAQTTLGPRGDDSTRAARRRASKASRRRIAKRSAKSPSHLGN